MPNVIVSEIAQVFTSAKKRATPRPKARSRSSEAIVPRIDDAEDDVHADDVDRERHEPEDVEEPRRPRDRHRVEGREDRLSGHRSPPPPAARSGRRATPASAFSSSSVPTKGGMNG